MCMKSCKMSEWCFVYSRRIFTVVYLIRYEMVRLDGSNVGVDQNRGDSGFLQGFQSLRSCTMDIPCQRSSSYHRAMSCDSSDSTSRALHDLSDEPE